jgi:hypothetical protein
MLKEADTYMAYESETDALRQLMLLRNYGGQITRTPEKILSMPDGAYYFVEVTSREGTKYIIEAYGKEALELEHEAFRRRLAEELVIKNQIV